eukprot:jgi/Psemu1/287667/fgenesh1_pg.207_\
MGNTGSSSRSYHDDRDLDDSGLPSFPGSTLVESALQCGNIEDTGTCDDYNQSKRGSRKKKSLAAQLLSRAENCVMSPQNSLVEGVNSDSDVDNGIRHPDSSWSEDDAKDFFDDQYEEFGRGHNNGPNVKVGKPQQLLKQPQSSSNTQQEDKTSSLLAKSLMSEVGDPNSMAPGAMTEREKKLLKAQEKARQHKLLYGVGRLNVDLSNSNNVVRPIGSPSEGVGQPSVLGSIAHVLKGNFNDPTGAVGGATTANESSVLPPNSLSANHAAQVEQRRGRSPTSAPGKHTVTIGLSLSRRSSSLGHPDTVTRQTAFDFNELQDREYKYVSSTDSSGWRAGGGERGIDGEELGSFFGDDENNNKKLGMNSAPCSGNSMTNPGTPNGDHNHKVAAPDTVHIPIIQIDAESPQVIDSIISALARGEIFIPHMAIIPEALSVDGVSPPDLVVRFGTERNEDLPPDEWPNWCLEFMHNQLYEYFHGMGARWAKRPFSITLAKKVRWKTVKHMNRYFSHAERVIDAWREKGPQYLDPQLAYIEGGATPEEVARPHGIYLFRNGVPTNYFAPNFHPPYTTKMTRSLLFNVLGKSWDKKRREWSSAPIPKLITPSLLVSAMCGCADNQTSGFVATEVTLVDGQLDRSTTVPVGAAVRSFTPKHKSAEKNAFVPEASPSSLKKKKKRNQRQDKEEEKKEENLDDDFKRPAVLSNNLNGMQVQASKEGTQIMINESDVDHSKHDDSEKSSQVLPTLKLQISSSSAPFFDGVGSDSNDIPSPPYKSFSSKEEDFVRHKHEQREPEQKQQQLAPLQNTVQSLEPQEQCPQEPQLEPRLATNSDETNDENSGDSKNHEPQNARGGKGKRLRLLIGRKKKKTQEATTTTKASDEEWLNDLGKPLTKTEYTTMASLKVERHCSDGEKKSDRGIDPVCDTFRDGRIGPGSPTVRSNNSSKSGRNALMNTKSNDPVAALSMEYSQDDSTLIGGKSVGEYTFDSTLLGQNFAADSKSVLSAATKETLPTKEVLEEVPEHSQHTHLSIGADSSYTTVDDEPIPSDEELFAAGWAKALDSNSGYYYYFTLDRKRTVWDNPLAPSSPTYGEGNKVGEI